jgi:nitrous oxide reductase accessory protein NosL
LTLKAIDAKSAFYVIGSNIKGPMGWDLIPFEKIDTTRQFLKKHEGKKIVRFQDITPQIVEKVDKNDF